MKIKTRIYSMVAVMMLTLVSTVARAQTAFVMTKEGVGCLKKGMAVSKIPSTCPGLYDRVEKEFIEDDFNGDYTDYTFYLGTEKVVITRDFGEGKIYFFDAYSPRISTSEGVHPGMPIKDFLKVKGAEIASYNDGVYLRLHGIDGYDIGYDRDDLTALGEKTFQDAYDKGTEVKQSNAYFKEGAKVSFIKNY